MNASFTDAQVEAIAAGFEALGHRLGALERRMDRLESTQRIVVGLLLVTMGGVFAPYIGRLLGA